MASRNIYDLHLYLQGAFNYGRDQFLIRHPNIAQPFLTCTNRPNAEQDQLYEQGRTLPGKIVTHAKAGESPHNYNPSFAFDIAFKKTNKELVWHDSLFKLFAEIVAEKYPEVVWGGNWKFKDAPHFELKNWKPLIKK